MAPEQHQSLHHSLDVDGDNDSQQAGSDPWTYLQQHCQAYACHDSSGDEGEAAEGLAPLRMTPPGVVRRSMRSLGGNVISPSSTPRQSSISASGAPPVDATHLSLQLHANGGWLSSPTSSQQRPQSVRCLRVSSVSTPGTPPSNLATPTPDSHGQPGTAGSLCPGGYSPHSPLPPWQPQPPQGAVEGSSRSLTHITGSTTGSAGPMSECGSSWSLNSSRGSSFVSRTARTTSASGVNTSSQRATLSLLDAKDGMAAATAKDSACVEAAAVAKRGSEAGAATASILEEARVRLAAEMAEQRRLSHDSMARLMEKLVHEHDGSSASAANAGATQAEQHLPEKADTVPPPPPASPALALMSASSTLEQPPSAKSPVPASRTPLFAALANERAPWVGAPRSSIGCNGRQAELRAPAAAAPAPPAFLQSTEHSPQAAVDKLRGYRSSRVLHVGVPPSDGGVLAAACSPRHSVYGIGASVSLRGKTFMERLSCGGSSAAGGQRPMPRMSAAGAGVGPTARSSRTGRRRSLDGHGHDGGISASDALFGLASGMDDPMERNVAMNRSFTQLPRAANGALLAWSVIPEGEDEADSSGFPLDAIDGSITC